MADPVLAGKKIAVLVESQYIAHEIRTYQDRFSGYGARVDVMSRLWGNPVITFVSEVEEAGRTPQTLEVGIDFADVAAADYAAIIMAANYTSVRLRWVEPPAGQPMSAGMARTAPAPSPKSTCSHLISRTGVPSAGRRAAVTLTTGVIMRPAPSHRS